MTDALISAHATSPAVRARCHHVCDAITTAAPLPVQLPRLRTRVRVGSGSGGAGSAGSVDATSSEVVDDETVDDETVDDGTVGATAMGSGSGGAAPPRPSWLTPAKVPAPTTPTTTAATYFAPVA